MAFSARSEGLFRKMRQLTAELDAIGHERDEAQMDAMFAHPVRADLSKLIRAWETKLGQIFRVEDELKDSLIKDGILPRHASKAKKKKR